MQTELADPLIHADVGFAVVSGIISAIGVVFLVALPLTPSVGRLASVAPIQKWRISK